MLKACEIKEARNIAYLQKAINNEKLSTCSTFISLLIQQLLALAFIYEGYKFNNQRDKRSLANMKCVN